LVAPWACGLFPCTHAQRFRPPSLLSAFSRGRLLLQCRLPSSTQYVLFRVTSRSTDACLPLSSGLFKASFLAAHVLLYPPPFSRHRRLVPRFPPCALFCYPPPIVAPTPVCVCRRALYSFPCNVFAGRAFWHHHHGSPNRVLAPLRISSAVLSEQRPLPVTEVGYASPLAPLIVRLTLFDASASLRFQCIMPLSLSISYAVSFLAPAHPIYLSVCVAPTSSSYTSLNF